MKTKAFRRPLQSKITTIVNQMKTSADPIYLFLPSPLSTSTGKNNHNNLVMGKFGLMDMKPEQSMIIIIIIIIIIIMIIINLTLSQLRINGLYWI